MFRELIRSLLKFRCRTSEIESSIKSINEKIDRVLLISEQTRSLVGPVGISMPDNTILTQTLWGHKLYVDALDLTMTPQLVVYRQWEAEISTLIASYLDKDSVFVDVGANLGYFTCLAGGKIGRSGHGQVVSIEPNPKMIDLLRRNISVNWSMSPIDIHEICLSDRDGFVQLSIPDNRSANAFVAVTEDPGANSISVPVRRLDDVLSEFHHVDLMKIDVEGYEWFVLSGAKEIIRRSKNIKIILEWSQGQMNQANISADDMLSLFSELDLVPCKLPLTFSGFSPAEFAWSLDELRTTQYDDIVLVPRAYSLECP